MSELMIVAVGGALGAVSRYLLGLLAINRWGALFPYGTMLANFLGCFIIGLFMTLVLERLEISPYWRLLVVTGFCGGLTTFSSFSYESLRLLQSGEYLLGALNVVLNMVIGFGLTIFGMYVATKF
ncbi:MAG: fluoride efflux transporter CrcB [Negativicutes bacterium]